MKDYNKRGSLDEVSFVMALKPVSSSLHKEGVYYADDSIQQAVFFRRLEHS